MRSGYQRDGVCRGCRTAMKERRWRRIQAMWHEGLQIAEIAARVGFSENHLCTEMARIRDAGWDLPHRYNLRSSRARRAA